MVGRLVGGLTCAYAFQFGDDMSYPTAVSARPPPETRALYFSEVFAVAEAEDGRCQGG